METTKHCRVEDIKIELSPEEYLSEYERKIKDLAKSLRVKGFRVGKVPVTYVKARFGQELLTEIVREKMQEKVKTFFQEQENQFLHPILLVESNMDFITEGKTYALHYKGHYLPALDTIDLTALQEIEVPEVILNEATLSRVIEESLRAGKAMLVETVPAEGDFGVLIKTTEEEEQERNIFLRGRLNTIDFPALREALAHKKLNDVVELHFAELGGGLFIALKNLHFYLPPDDPRFEHIATSPVKVIVKEIVRYEKVTLQDEGFLRRWGFSEPVPEEVIQKALLESLQKTYHRNLRNSYLLLQLVERLISQYPSLIDPAFVESYADYLRKDMEHAFRRIKESSESEWMVQRIASIPDYYIRLARYSLYRRLLFQIIEANHPRYRVTDEDVEEILKDEVRQTLMAKRAEGERTVSEEEVNAVTQALKHYNPDVFEKTHSQLTLDRIYALVTEQLPHKVVKMPIEVFHERYYALAFQLNAPL